MARTERPPGQNVLPRRETGEICPPTGALTIGRVLAPPVYASSRRNTVRIALVSEFYYPHLGGVTEHVHNLALQFQRQGHPTIVVTAHMETPARGIDLDHEAR